MIYIHVPVYIHTQVYGGQRWTSVFFCRFPHSFLRQNLSPNLELPRMQVGWLASQWASRIYLSLPSSTGVRCSPPCPAFAWLLGYWDPNSGPHAYRADTLAMEPSPQPRVGRILAKKKSIDKSLCRLTSEREGGNCRAAQTFYLLATCRMFSRFTIP